MILFLFFTLFIISKSAISNDESFNRIKRDEVDLLALIERYCEKEMLCIEDTLEDLISYVRDEPYNEDELHNYEGSLFTELLEAVDQYCSDHDQVVSCKHVLLHELSERVLDDDLPDDNELLLMPSDKILRQQVSNEYITMTILVTTNFFYF